MKNILINFFATILVAFLLSFVLPWWSVMTAALVTSLFFPLKRAAVFFVPFLAILVFWGLYSFILSSGNDYTLAKRVATLLYLGGNPYMLMIVTGVIGGLAAGFTAIFGKQFAALSIKKR
ncbi:hypothetical protein BWZ20_13365 [Winogradskyella sp. J14-2]|uniref:hypothetical protein n=1 Tax=Winogradskyella sp. J14-2 TaxID=1936080 RepID=UPI00097297B2|nr:hypothetical protein [Winogradskyella sp. J14-2]APY09230.1 hypothetical protein BWZ20_13365 [Winogradskyella sp. J14-2]